MSENKGKNKLLGNIASLGIVQIANYVFPFITIPIVSRILGPEKIGLVNYFISFSLYFVFLVAYSFDVTGVRRAVRFNNNQKELNLLFSKIFTAQLLLFGLALLLFGACLLFIDKFKSNWQIATISFALCLQFLFSQNWIFQTKQELKFVALFNFIGKFFLMVAVLLFIHQQSDYFYYSVILNVIPIITALLSFIIAVKKFKLNFVKVSLNEVISLMKEDKMVFLSGVVIVLYTSTSTVLLGFFQNNVEVGYYTSAQKLVEISKSIVVTPLSQALFPIIGTAMAKGSNKGLELVKNILPLFTAITLIIFIGMAVLGPYVVVWFFGKEFQSSVLLLEILNFGLVAVFFGVFIGAIVMTNLNMDMEYFKISGIAAIFSLLLNLLFVKKYGAVATATIWSVTEIAISFFQIYILRKKNIILFNRQTFTLAGIKNAISYIKVSK